ncbi:MAG: hypothetical protein ABGX16_19770, partial [Pirellulales bacterium]
MMFPHSLAFDSAQYLWLLVLIPLVGWMSYSKGNLVGLGRWRRHSVFLLRSLVLTLTILALADIQYQRKNDRLTVLYL